MQIESEARIAMEALVREGSLVPPAFLSFKEGFGMLAVYPDAGTDMLEVSCGMSLRDTVAACTGPILCDAQPA
jgi:hypothetical protein